MKKVLLTALLFTTVLIFEFCNSSRKAQKTITAPETTYTTNVQNVVATNCAPCHVGPGARQKRLDSYDAVKSNIDDIIHRIQLNPTDKGFMPKMHPKLADSTVQVFVSWKNSGLMQ